ncbi:MAG: gamma-butyrobetaine hydroxylase-like domain-containing protein [Gammaproteobacteria bacterium]
MNDAAPVEIKLRTKSRCLQMTWPDGVCHELGFEYLRVNSPSAEVRGHAQSQAVLQSGKRDVRITQIDPVGHYALKLTFSDAHNSGLFTWPYFRELGETFETRWPQYLHDLDNAGLSRDAAKPDA